MARCYIFELSMSMKQLDRHSSNAVRSRSCALFPGALGDFICFLPALQTLARDSEVDLFARSEFADIVASEVTVHALESHEVSRLFTANIAEDQPLRNFLARMRRSIRGWAAGRAISYAVLGRSLAAGRRYFRFNRMTAKPIKSTTISPVCAGTAPFRVNHKLHCAPRELLGALISGRRASFTTDRFW